MKAFPDSWRTGSATSRSSPDVVVEEGDNAFLGATRNPQRMEVGPSFSVLGQEILRHGPHGVSEGPNSTEFQLPQWWTVMDNLLPFLSLGSLPPISSSVLPEITSHLFQSLSCRDSNTIILYFSSEIFNNTGITHGFRGSHIYLLPT